MSRTDRIIKAVGRISVKKSGGSGYNSYWVYIPSKIAKHEEFPFSTTDKVDIELSEEGKLVISKHDRLRDIINEYGLENASLPKVLESKANENTNRPFLYFKDNVYSYQDINVNSNRIAHGIIELLEQIGIRKPDQKLKRMAKICAILPNSPEFIFCWFGVVKARCMFIPIDMNLKKNLLEEMLDEIEADILIVDYESSKDLMQTYKNNSKIKKIVLMNAPSNFRFDNQIISFEEVYINNKENPEIEVKGRHEMEIIYTAGTTGKPKGLVFRNYYVLTGSNMGKELEKIGLNEKSIIYCPLPLCHALGQLLAIFPALFYNASVVITEKFDAKTFWEEVKRYKITGLIYFGNLLQQLISQTPNKYDRQHMIKWAFGFGPSKEIWEAFENRFAIPIYEGWTLTEAVGVTINKMGSEGGKVGSVGKAVTGYEVKIVDEEGNTLPAGVNNVGQFVARSTIPIPLEYYKLEGKKISPQDSWVETKDYGYKDQDGFYYYVGRESDIIHANGETFFSMEIEHLVNSHPYVLECAAFEVKSHDTREEEIKLCVVLKRAGSIKRKELYEYLNLNLANFMVPRYIEFKENLPKSSNYFIQKFKLKQEWNNPVSQEKTWDAKKNMIN